MGVPPTESVAGQAARNDLSSELGEPFLAACPDRTAVSPPLSKPKPTPSA